MRLTEEKVQRICPDKGTINTEYRIIQAVQQGDREAYAELVRRHHAGVLRLCLSFMLSLAEAEDAAQEAFLKGFVSLHTYREDISFQAWMSRIASNHCLDLLRKRKRQKTDSLDNLLEQAGDSGDTALQTIDEPSTVQVEDQERSAFAMKALSELSAGQRQILTLRELDGLRYDEIARVLGCSLDGVKARLRRSREALQAHARHFSDEASVKVVGANP